MSAPKLSVIMPLYNALPFVKDAIDSILYQTFADFELLIVDNGSTDGSLEYAMSLPDPRIRVLKEEKRGAGKAITAGIFASRAEFVAIMDADDLAPRDRLQIQFDFLQNSPEIVLVGGRFAWMVGSEVVPVPPQPKDHQDIRQAFLEGRTVICNSSTMFRTAPARAVGGHRLSGAGHDHDFFLRMMEIGKVTNIPDLLHYYRLHDGSTSIRKAGELYEAHQFSIECAKARDRGEPEPDLASFSKQWKRRPFFARFAERVDGKSLQLYRTSVIMRAKKQFLLSLAASIGAALLSPRRTNWHLKRKLGLC